MTATNDLSIPLESFKPKFGEVCEHGSLKRCCTDCELAEAYAVMKIIKNQCSIIYDAIHSEAQTEIPRLNEEIYNLLDKYV